MLCFLAGFTDGSVVLTKGDITRDRHSKTLTLHEGTSPVTGLAFRQVAKVTHLFVATLEKVHVSLVPSRTLGRMEGYILSTPPEPSFSLIIIFFVFPAGFKENLMTV